MILSTIPHKFSLKSTNLNIDIFSSSSSFFSLFFFFVGWSLLLRTLHCSCWVFFPIIRLLNNVRSHQCWHIFTHTVGKLIITFHLVTASTSHRFDVTFSDEINAYTFFLSTIQSIAYYANIMNANFMKTKEKKQRIPWNGMKWKRCVWLWNNCNYSNRPKKWELRSEDKRRKK